MKLTKTEVDKLVYSKQPKTSKMGKISYPADYHWDSEIKGFGVRVFPSGRKSFLISYRNSTGSKRFHTLGEYGVLTAQQAREMAKKRLAEIWNGDDPQAERVEKRKEMSFEAASKEYLEQSKDRKKSWKSDHQRMNDHILPSLRHRKLSEITRQDIELMIRKVKEKHSSSTANRCLALVRHMLNQFMEGNTPASGLKPYPEPPPRDIVLDIDQIHRLISALDTDDNIVTASLFKMAMFTGRRPGELRNAKWKDINFERRMWHLPDTKAGEQQYVPLSPDVLEILDKLPRVEDNPYVFAGVKSGKPIQHYDRAWKRIIKRAGIPYIPPYGLRHNFASLLVAENTPLPAVQALMGHKSIQTTMRYTHHRQDHLFDATSKFGNIVSYTAEKDRRKAAHE